MQKNENDYYYCTFYLISYILLNYYKKNGLKYCIRTDVMYSITKK